MRLIIFSILIATGIQGPNNASGEPLGTQGVSDTAETLDDCQERLKDLKNDITSLEFFLQDKKDHKTYCPNTGWTQPPLEKYKKEPKSHLPKGCKPEERIF